jgi:hypothetical protein
MQKLSSTLGQSLPIQRDANPQPSSTQFPFSDPFFHTPFSSVSFFLIPHLNSLDRPNTTATLFFYHFKEPSEECGNTFGERYGSPEKGENDWAREIVMRKARQSRYERRRKRRRRRRRKN